MRSKPTNLKYLTSGVMPKSAICTLFEGAYHYGVGSLVNSVYQHGFRGTIWAGYRGELPPWAEPLRSTNRGHAFDVGEGCTIQFVLLDTSTFFSNYKPHFLLEVWKHTDEDTRLFYFDPDIVTKCRWSFFEEWVDSGVALCLDNAYPYMPASHPLRNGWRAFAEDLELDTRRSPNHYFNAGFIGVRREHRQLLVVWRDLMEALRESGINIESFKNYEGYNDIDRSHPFYVADQDALNLAIMIEDVPLSIMGTEGMDFTGAGFTMSHAVDAPKPWDKNITAKLLTDGSLAGLSDREFLSYIDEPIELYPPLTQRLKWIDFYLSKIIGSFFHRH